jgi:hypothetical protein
MYTLTREFIMYLFCLWTCRHSRSRWSRGQRRGFGTACFLDCWFESHRGHGFLYLVTGVFSARNLCVGPFTHPFEYYRVWCVQWVWSRSHVSGGHGPVSGRMDTEKNTYRRTIWRTYSKVSLPHRFCSEKLGVLSSLLCLKWSWCFYLD